MVLSTLASATSGDGALKHLAAKNTSADVASSSGGSPFDVAVIDECSQSMEMACWIPILQTKKVHIRINILEMENAQKFVDVIHGWPPFGNDSW